MQPKMQAQNDSSMPRRMAPGLIMQFILASFLHIKRESHVESSIVMLKERCFELCEETKGQDPSLLMLLQHATNAWLFFIDYQESMKKSRLTPKAQKSFLHFRFQKFHKTILQFQSQLIPVLKSFHRDENVLFYLLRYHSHFDAAYGHGFTIDLFNSFFQHDPNEMKDYLIARYRERGFAHLIPIVEEKFKQLYPYLSYDTKPSY